MTFLSLTPFVLLSLLYDKKKLNHHIDGRTVLFEVMGYLE